VAAFWSTIRGFNRSIRLWLLVWALGAFAYFGLQGVLLNLYLLRLGFGPQFIGVLVGSGQIIWGLAALPAGAFGRRAGLRTALQAALVLMTLGFGLLPLVEAMPRPLWEAGLFACWAVTWTGAALMTVNSVPYAMALASQDERNAVFPTQQAVIALATFIGSLAAGALPGIISAWTGVSLEEAGPFRAALSLVPLLFLVSLLAIAGAREARPDSQVYVTDAQTQPPPIGLFLVVGAITFLQSAAEGPIRAFFNVYLDRGLGIAPAQIGLIIGLGQLLPVAMAILAVRLLTRLGAALTLAFASLGTFVAYLPLAAIAAWGTAGLGFTGVMMMASVHSPARNVLTQELVIPRWRTITPAMVTIGTALGWATTAAAGGFMIANIGFGGLFAVSAGLAAGASALAWGTHRVRTPRVAASAGAQRVK
jgi:predicted MFS family arabinose efflux permease